MEEEVNTKNAPISLKEQKNKKEIAVFLFCTILLCILFLLIGARTNITYLAADAPAYKAEIAPDDKKTAFPEYFRYLEDSSFSNWTALVKGEIVSKDTNSFILNPVSEKYDDTGNVTISNLSQEKNLKIVVPPSKVTFYEANADPKQASKKINFQEVGVNVIARGTVNVIYLNDEILLEATTFSLSKK